MKKLLLAIFLVFLISVPAIGQDWINTNQATVAWDAVTQDEGGSPIPVNDSISYRVYTKKLPNGAENLVANTQELQYTLTFGVEGRYLAGVQTVRVPDGETQEITSTITWSDSTDVVAVPDPFGIVYYARPSNPKGFTPASP